MASAVTQGFTSVRPVSQRSLIYQALANQSGNPIEVLAFERVLPTEQPLADVFGLALRLGWSVDWKKLVSS